jgi:adenylate kinase family enzyme
MRRILIVGGSGAGKTTLALSIAERTGLPVHHLDRQQRMAGWVRRSPADRLAAYVAIRETDGWIVDCSGEKAEAAFVGHADTVLWLDVNIATRLWRIYRRIAQFSGRNRPDQPEGRPKRSALHLVRYLYLVWRNRRGTRRRHAALSAAPPAGSTVLRLASDADIRAFLDGLRK